ncbi:hypothetical protein [Hyphomicrobium sp. CS1GBMeth3]|uniref:hypothetical protein n=1 Tax=Hyphomicrobium sp. CS1GBMeth3 TaxID=1892845 RepID=UPI00092FDE9B|nr:hypothetical protein [Hyphomicrobium sp. CS1GBMeth3]
MNRTQETAIMPPANAGNAIARPRIFVLKDDPTRSLNVIDTCRELGCDIVGPERNLSPHVMELASNAHVDVAVVQLVLQNTSCDPVIWAFLDRGVPVLICSALMANAVRRTYPGAEVLRERYSREELCLALNRLLLSSERSRALA